MMANEKHVQKMKDLFQALKKAGVINRLSGTPKWASSYYRDDNGNWQWGQSREGIISGTLKNGIKVSAYQFVPKSGYTRNDYIIELRMDLMDTTTKAMAIAAGAVPTTEFDVKDLVKVKEYLETLACTENKKTIKMLEAMLDNCSTFPVPGVSRQILNIIMADPLEFIEKDKEREYQYIRVLRQSGLNYTLQDGMINAYKEQAKVVREIAHYFISGDVIME